ncbi:MAG: unnamed protein product [uncultured Paraburkholderia sp.]|nr:MAG: unnamed protein product [uncultured Paraburkholderia sp.]CAH2783654.1 MAG: unnamed protein product [uncultured Paraburkholderia sp.]CAH2917798.1 MAG: unnamed protein product [uncultured Paraburkholderia sp.]
MIGLFSLNVPRALRLDPAHKLALRSEGRGAALRLQCSYARGAAGGIRRLALARILETAAQESDVVPGKGITVQDLTDCSVGVAAAHRPRLHLQQVHRIPPPLIDAI